MAKENDFSIAFIGGGNMANAISNGIINKICTANNIHILDTDQIKLSKWKTQGMTASTCADSRLSQCKIWIYSVKPQEMQNAIRSTKTWLNQNTLIVSIAAGVSLNILYKWFGENSSQSKKIIRCMPNMPALIGEGISGLIASYNVSTNDRELVSELFKNIGTVIWITDENDFHAITALSGSGPAYVFLFLESMIDGGVALGLNKEQSYKLAISTLSGATRLMAQTSMSPSLLRECVTSKGGTTEAALKIFDSCDFKNIVKNAMIEAAKRSISLSQKLFASD
ncbi:MAG: pyrroline-5-carboxylate reductase [Bordetella sp.]|nr:MAG: pyrroline-5-carboxylate reductase [Bordetella sp.]